MNRLHDGSLLFFVGILEIYKINNVFKYNV